MKRKDIFKLVHKGIRCMLYGMSQELQQVDFRNENSAEEVLIKLKELFNILKIYADYEDRFILPAIAIHNKELVQYFDGQHRHLQAMIQKIFERVSFLSHAQNENEREEAGDQLLMCFNHYLCCILHHLCEEEEKLNAAIWQYYSDEQIKRIEKAIIAGISCKDMQVYIHWMIDGISNYELVNWFISVKNDASDAIFKCLLTQAEEQLPAERWEAIKEHLTEGMLLN